MRVIFRSLVLAVLCSFVLNPLALADEEEWNVQMIGAVNMTLSKMDFENLAETSYAEYIDENGDVFSGVPLITILGLIDDVEDDPTFHYDAAQLGYSIVIVGEDGYSAEISSLLITDDADIILANRVNNEPFPAWNAPPYPLKVYGADITLQQSVGNIATIELKGLVLSEPGDETTLNEEIEADAILYSGSIALENVMINVATGSGNAYEVNELTPLGALVKAAEKGGYSFVVTDHSYEDRGILLLDAINEYQWEKDTSDLIIAVNGATVEDWGTDSDKFYNVYSLTSGDKIAYLYGVPPVSVDNGQVLVELTVL